jgi:PPP family 3-phenylpropionic acid transporter
VLAFTLRDERSPRVTGGADWRALLRQRTVLVLLAACFLMNMAHGPFYAFFSIHLGSLGFSKTAIGLLWSLGVLAEITVFWLQPRWAGRWSMDRVFAASMLCAVLRFALVAVAGDNVTALVIAQLLHAATFGTWHVSALAILQRECPPAARARAHALYMGVSFGAGGMVGSLASGALWDALGAWTFMVASGCALAGMAVFSRRSPSAGGRVAIMDGRPR